MISGEEALYYHSLMKKMATVIVQMRQQELKPVPVLTGKLWEIRPMATFFR